MSSSGSERPHVPIYHGQTTQKKDGPVFVGVTTDPHCSRPFVLCEDDASKHFVKLDAHSEMNEVFVCMTTAYDR